MIKDITYSLVEILFCQEDGTSISAIRMRNRKRAVPYLRDVAKV